MTPMAAPELSELCKRAVAVLQQRAHGVAGHKEIKFTNPATGEVKPVDLAFVHDMRGGFLSSTIACDAFRDVSLALGKDIGGKMITPKGMRRTNEDLMRAAGVSNLVAMAISNHEDEGMHAHYSMASGDEKREAMAMVVSLFRRVG